MKINWKKLTKQVRFYVFMVSFVAILLGVILKGIYMYEYKKIENVVKDRGEYTYTTFEGNTRTEEVYYTESTGYGKWEIRDILDRKLGDRFVYNHDSMSFGLFLINTPILIISAVMCYFTMIPDDVKNEKAIKAEKQREANALARDRQLEREYDEAVASSSGAPWETKYFTDPCPYCGHYKVRYAEWNDKAMSTAFWGVWSNKLHSHYKCDSCKRMW